MSTHAPSYAIPDRRAAIYSALLPGLGQLIRGRYGAGLFYGLVTILLILLSLALGRVSGRAAEVFFFMLLALPWWALQSYDAALGPSESGSDLARSTRTAWAQGHDIRFLGLLFLVSAGNDALLIARNPDYLLPFFVPGWTARPGSSPKRCHRFSIPWPGMASYESRNGPS